MNAVFVTLYAESNPRTRAFYGRLGIDFAPEKHGSGPDHLAAPLRSAALEIYPRADSSPPFFLGIETSEDVHALKAELIEKFGGTECDRASAAFVALRDPAGIEVRLFPMARPTTPS